MNRVLWGKAGVQWLPLLASRLRLAGGEQVQREGARQQRQGGHPVNVLRGPPPLRDDRLCADVLQKHVPQNAAS